MHSIIDFQKYLDCVKKFQMAAKYVGTFQEAVNVLEGWWGLYKVTIGGMFQGAAKVDELLTKAAGHT